VEWDKAFELSLLSIAKAYRVFNLSLLTASIEQEHFQPASSCSPI
jgi:hypothetical protein